MHALLLSSVLTLAPTDDPVKGQCTVSAVGCVFGQLGKFDASTGVVCDIATVGTPPAGKCKYRVELFVGVEVKEKVIFLGKAGVKAGLSVTCEVDIDKGPFDKSVIEKKVLPQLLSHPEVKKAAGGKAVQLVPDPKVEVVTPARFKEVRGGFAPAKK